MYRILFLLVLLMSSVTGLFAQEDGEHNQYEGEAFSLAYSAQWELSETDERVQLRFEDYVLTIHTTDERMSLPAGEFERRKLIGQYGIPVDALLYEGRVKQVLYGQLQSPEAILTILLSVETAQNVDYDEIDIPQTVIDEASMIVSSIVFDTVELREVVVMPFFSGETNPIDAWQAYMHPSQSFGFRYPDTWTLQESANQITLSRDDVQFIIAYADIEHEPPTVESELMLSSNVQSRVPIYGMFQAIPSQAIDPDEAGAGAVIYNTVSTADNLFTMWITHNNDDLVDWATIDEADTIISTFQTRPQSASSSD